MIKELQQTLYKLRQQNPLVLCLTNHVTMDFMANALLALGAAPLMSESLPELNELMALAKALTINLGTLNENFIARSMHAAQLAQQFNLPLVLDPVGAGASQLRTQTARDFLVYTNIIRGNASEIMALAGDDILSHGVESKVKVIEAQEAARSLVNEASVIVVSGEIDYICDARHSQDIPYGHALMAKITGMGCTLTAVIAAFAAVVDSYYQAAVQASHYFALCGQVVGLDCHSPGTFRTLFIDQLYNPSWDIMAKLVGE